MTSSLDGLKSFLNTYDCIVESRKANIDICTEEFQQIKQQSIEDKKEFACLEGARDPNKKKNRYKDILPYDHSRVVLSKYKSVDGSDYINANHVQDESGRKAYIAAQGPMPHTVNDFWRMIWQFKIKMVIMGCKEVEMGKNRCHRYWAEAGEEVCFNDIRVTLIDSKIYAHNMKLRYIKAEQNGTSHTLIQLHYMDWPDHGAPETTETILQLIEVLREKHPTDEPPILIHCSAGCGRTGAIIATDCGRKVIQAHGEGISVLNIVSRLRKNRPALVQSKEQYEFLYEVFREMVTREMKKCESLFEDSNYMNINDFQAKPSPPSFPSHAVPPPSFPSHAVPTAPPLFTGPTSLPAAQPGANESAIIISEYTSNAKRQLVLPQEHVVNTEPGFRRSRSAYIKKPIHAAGPPVPVKENKHGMEKMEIIKKGPVLPPKSPNLQRRSADVTKQNIPNPEGSSTVQTTVSSSKPRLLKKPSLESFFTPPNRTGDYLNLVPSGIKPQEDFIPAPTPVGYNQYPKRSQMSQMSPIVPPTVSQPKLPSKSVKNKNGNSHIASGSPQNAPCEPSVNREAFSGNAEKLKHVSSSLSPPNQTSVSTSPKNHRFSAPPNPTSNPFYVPDQTNQNSPPTSKDHAFGVLSSSFQTTIVKAEDGSNAPDLMRFDTNSPLALHKEAVNKESGCDYAVVNKNAKPASVKEPQKKCESDYALFDRNSKLTLLKDCNKESSSGVSKHYPKTPPIYETLSEDIINDVGSNNVRKVEKTSTKKGENTSEVLQRSSQVETATKNVPPIAPYTVTEIGVGYKKSVDERSWQPNLGERAQSKSTKFRSHREKPSPPPTREAGPPVPVRRGVSFPPQIETGITGVSTHPEIPTFDSNPMPSLTGKNWFNAKVRGVKNISSARVKEVKNIANMARRESSPPVDSIFKHSFDINDEFGFGKRLHHKPSGPRPPPASWKVMPPCHVSTTK